MIFVLRALYDVRMIDKHNEPEFLTPRETAAILRMAPSTLAIWRFRQRYDLPYRRIGRKILYRREDVLQFANKQIVER